MKDYLTIKEFSKLSGIEQTTLRYWDEIGLFVPAKRNSETNYRYYTPWQMIAAKFVTVMSGLDVPLKVISETERGRTPKSIRDLIFRQEKHLDMQMRLLRERYSVIHTRVELINMGLDLESDGAFNASLNGSGCFIIIADREDRAYIPGPPNDFGGKNLFFEPLMNFYKKAEEMRINTNYPIGGLHGDIEAFLKAPAQPEYFFSMDPTGNRLRPAGKYLIGLTRGYYGELNGLPEKMNAYIKERKLAVSGPVYTVYLFDEVCMAEQSQYLAQVSVAVSNV
ncbi:MAG: MerR family transcriptional regulator [Clostridiales bacterium]|jgi:DNA-binding transcriptional MerR regulator/effector-binding domain-containing protein|nr:MerR family transcriptional regulator [Clostridiales bacterium]